MHSLLVSHISYWLKIKGLAFNADTACSSSMYALDAAYRTLLNNNCDYAIVATSSLCLEQVVSLQFAL